MSTIDKMKIINLKIMEIKNISYYLHYNNINYYYLQ
jgi:hypothetical protein